MNITDRILKTIKKIALDKNKPEEEVSWNEIAVEQAIELNDLFALHIVSRMFKEKNTQTFENWTENNGYTQINEQYFANVKGLTHIDILYLEYKKEQNNQP